MKPLKITNLITEYYDDFTREINNYYLDKQTGDIVIIDSMLQQQWEDEGEIDKDDLPQWQQENYETMMAVFRNEHRRYVQIPSVDTAETADIMRDFARTVQNEKIAGELFETLQGAKSFRRFRAVLNRYDNTRHAYYDYREKCYLKSLEAWLAEIGIKAEWVD